MSHSSHHSALSRHFEQGGAALSQGRSDEAIEHAQAVLKAAPRHPEALNLLGVSLWQAGRYGESETALREAIAAQPSTAGFYLNLARTLVELRRGSEAAEAAEQALSRNSQLPDGWLLLGNSFLIRKDYARAAEHYQRALQLRPDFADARNNLCGAYIRLDRLKAAVEEGRKALELKPDYVDAMSNLGAALLKLKRLDEAEPLLERAVALQPGFVSGIHNLGKLRAAQRRPVAAVELFRRALSLSPNDADVHASLGGSLANWGLIAEAIAEIRLCLSLQPDQEAAGGNLLFAANYHPDWSPEQILAEYQAWAATQPREQDATRFTNPAEPERRLRIGYVSPDFRGHACHYFIEPLFCHHDVGQVEVYAYSETTNQDAVTERLKGMVSHWRDTFGVSDDALQAQIMADGIDILVDLAGHTGGNRLAVFARRAAPIQVTWMGYGHTTGLTSMDYFVADDWFLPKGAESYITEHPWRLPNVAFCYRPSETAPEPGPLPALRNGFVTFGSLTRTIRLNERVVATWARILHETPGSRLRLDHHVYAEEAFSALIVERFARHGITPDRLDLANTRPHWDAYQDIDISLDPFPHNAGATTLESLWMGVPVISLMDRPPLGRFGATYLHAVGLDDWLTADVASYVARAVRAAADLDHLVAFRQVMRQQMRASPLLDEAGFTRDLEAAYRAMWREWCAGSGEREARRLVARMLQTALRLHQSGAVDQAADLYHMILQVEPTQGDALNLLGVVALQRGDHAQAERLARQAVAVLPEFAAAHGNLGNALSAQGRHEEAASALLRAIQLEPDYLDAHFNLGNTLTAMQRRAEAITEYHKVVALQPDHARAWQSLGNLLLAKGDREAAKLAFQALLALPDIPQETLKSLGEGLRVAGLEAEAAIALRCLNARLEGGEHKENE